MADRRRVVAFAVLVVLCLVGAGAAIVSAMGDRDAQPGASGERDALLNARATGAPTVLYRSAAKGAGQVAVAPAASPATHTEAPLRCDRVYFAGGAGVCVTRGTGFASGYRVATFGADMGVRHQLDVEGIPSRARVSPDGRIGSVTMFVTGHSYANAGRFSTATTLIDLHTGERLANLEDFVVTQGDRQLTAVDMNFWGVTFARDSDRFYATLATGGKTYLIQGSVTDRTARVLHENVECPSLSPDGTRIAYKRRTGSPARPWHLTVLDLDTMRETPLAEPRSVDDQVEWLDDDHVLYGVDGQISTVPADGSGAPRRFIAQAGSPAVVRW
jgi:hypothetical protein